jgi:hypothetical protein
LIVMIWIGFYLHWRYSCFISCVDGYNHRVLSTQQDAIYKVVVVKVSFWVMSLKCHCTYCHLNVGHNHCSVHWRSKNLSRRSYRRNTLNWKDTVPHPYHWLVDKFAPNPKNRNTFIINYLIIDLYRYIVILRLTHTYTQYNK